MSEIATFGNGCFWCTEAIFQRVDGVTSVISGYSGGSVKNPTYKEVCSGLTGHAEVVQVTFDPARVSYTDLLEIFWRTHDPTTLNRQGNDVGSQYRSAIFYHSESQRLVAEEIKQKLGEAGVYALPIVTEIVPFERFYKAEDDHQNYFNDNGNVPYCAIIVQPKVEKFKRVFSDKVKKNV
jgi:peptide-methionine (S)-S-oxide reductase